MYGPDTFWEIFALTLSFNTFRSLGIGAVGMIYYALLGLAPEGGELHQELVRVNEKTR